MVNVAGAALVVAGPDNVVAIAERWLLLRCRNSRSRWKKMVVAAAFRWQGYRTLWLRFI